MKPVLNLGDVVTRHRTDGAVDEAGRHTYVIVGYKGEDKWSGELYYCCVLENTTAPDDRVDMYVSESEVKYERTLTKDELLTHRHKKVWRLGKKKVLTPYVRKWTKVVPKTNMEWLRLFIHSVGGNPSFVAYKAVNNGIKIYCGDGLDLRVSVHNDNPTLDDWYKARIDVVKLLNKERVVVKAELWSNRSPMNKTRCIKVWFREPNCFAV